MKKMRTSFGVCHCLAMIMGLLAATASVLAHDDRAIQPRAGEALSGLNADEQARFNAGRIAYFGEITTEQGLGPIFNARSCVTCHGVDGGNGIDAVEQFGVFDPTTGFDPLVHLGGPVKQAARIEGCSLDLESIPAEANVLVNRRTIGTTGFGLVEAILDADILANEANNGGDVSGRAHRVESLEEPGVERIGRFG
ncbi:MAG: hypothetical protein MK082_12090, partial [Phycisphaerales bacterium]|nr:hypothetical protein [Phycisphaerales bacterium]